MLAKSRCITSAISRTKRFYGGGNGIVAESDSWKWSRKWRQLDRVGIQRRPEDRRKMMCTSKSDDVLKRPSFNPTCRPADCRGNHRRQRRLTETSRIRSRRLEALTTIAIRGWTNLDQTHGSITVGLIELKFYFIFIFSGLSVVKYCIENLKTFKILPSTTLGIGQLCLSDDSQQPTLLASQNSIRRRCWTLWWQKEMRASRWEVWLTASIHGLTGINDL